MIAIEFVKVTINGQVYLIGRRFQDRWNLESLGVTGPILADRNQAFIKKMRRFHTSEGFTFTVRRAAKVEAITQAESLLIGNVNTSVAA